MPRWSERGRCRDGPDRSVRASTRAAGDRSIETKITGIRPGEKVHEILVSEEEGHRTVERGAYYAILPMLPELRSAQNGFPGLRKEYSSADDVMTFEETVELLQNQKLMPEHMPAEFAEVLR